MEPATSLLLGPFADLPDPEREQLARSAPTLAYPAGALIWNRGDNADHLLVLQSGMVAVQSGEQRPGQLGGDRPAAVPPSLGTDSIHRTLTLAVLGAEDVLGEMALAGVPRRTAAALALTETVALRVDVRPLRDMRRANAEVDAIALAILADTVRRLTDQLIEATFVSQPIRLRRILLRLSRLNGEAAIPVTQAQLAEMLGAQRTTVTALIAAEEAAGHVVTRRGHILVVDEPGLRAAARG